MGNRKYLTDSLNPSDWNQWIEVLGGIKYRCHWWGSNIRKTRVAKQKQRRKTPQPHHKR